ncbi:hypothetical protein [Pararhodobacter marinus]|uniref:hypothetical protein n=1 Tax=Pararhodobacter marinus TaxID=2184063 RepID=UPI0035184B0B
MTLLVAILARVVGATAARILAPIVACLAVVALIWGAWCLHEWQADRIISAAVEAREAELVSVSALATAEAALAKAQREAAAAQAAAEALEESRADADAEFQALLDEHNAYVEANQNAPADCTVSPDLLRLLRR